MKEEWLNERQTLRLKEKNRDPDATGSHDCAIRRLAVKEEYKDCVAARMPHDRCRINRASRKKGERECGWKKKGEKSGEKDTKRKSWRHRGKQRKIALKTRKRVF